jgi:hypothetical protein
MALPNPAPPPKKSGFSPDIMNTLQKQNAPAKEMSPAEIIKSDAEKKGTPDSWKNTYSQLVKTSKLPTFRIFRANNSLYPYAITGKGQAFGNIISADDPQKMLESLKEFKKAFTAAGFKKLESDTVDPQILQAYKQAGFNVQESMGERVNGDKASPAIHMVMNLGGM